MENFFASFFQSADYNDEQGRKSRRLLQYALLIVVAVSIAVTIIDAIGGGRATTLYALGSLAILGSLAYGLLFRGITWPARIVIPLGGLIAINYLLFVGNGIHDIAISAFSMAVILGGLTLGVRGAILFGILTTLSVVLVGVADMNGLIASSFTETGISDIAIIASVVMGSTLILSLMLNRLQQNIARMKATEEIVRQRTEEMETFSSGLEKLVEERTVELQSANLRNERRAAQFEAIAQVARSITVMQDLDTLLENFTTLVGEPFGFYHVGIFLLDDNHRFAVLRAATSEGGKEMVRNGHKLEVGETGVVGYAAGTGRPRIALSVGEDAVHFANPLLPDTRSEMALPMRVGQEIVGVLDVQSTADRAFTQEDIAIFSTLADQISVAIQNVRSYQEAQRLLSESQRTISDYLQSFWQGLRSIQPQLGYRISENIVQPLDRPLDTLPVLKALEQGIIVADEGQNASFASLAIPVRLRGEVIGVMDIRVPERGTWDQDNIDIAEAVAERLSIAIETATLLQTTRSRAEIERATSDISGKISASTRFDSILRTAAEELSRVLGNSEVVVQIRPGALQPDPEARHEHTQ
ncbi:MAG: GAF domain-containing protein [Anaerolineales bacterium]|nr:GAF domain-containing protein [Anaerolineales bacterium]